MGTDIRTGITGITGYVYISIVPEYDEHETGVYCIECAYKLFPAVGSYQSREHENGLVALSADSFPDVYEFCAKCDKSFQVTYNNECSLCMEIPEECICDGCPERLCVDNSGTPT